MFEMALDRIRHDSPRYYLIGGYFSPTSDGYQKAGLAPAIHRIHMCQLATEHSSWIMVDPWEALQPQWQRTVLILDHFNEELNLNPSFSFSSSSGEERSKIRIMLLAGGDLIESFGTPLLWSPFDVSLMHTFFAPLVPMRSFFSWKGLSVNLAVSS